MDRIKEVCHMRRCSIALAQNSSACKHASNCPTHNNTSASCIPHLDSICLQRLIITPCFCNNPHIGFNMASLMSNLQQKLNTLRLEADQNQAKAEELQTKVKSLEQENLAKEQEITSLTHQNQLLSAEVEKLEKGIKEAKSAADESSEHTQQNEGLRRRLQLLEDEAEQADKTIRETNEKYVQFHKIVMAAR